MDKKKLAYDLSLVYVQELLHDLANGTDSIQSIEESGQTMVKAFTSQYDYVLSLLEDIEI